MSNRAGGVYAGAGAVSAEAETVPDPGAARKPRERFQAPLLPAVVAPRSPTQTGTQRSEAERFRFESERSERPR